MSYLTRMVVDIDMAGRIDRNDVGDGHRDLLSVLFFCAVICIILTSMGPSSQGFLAAGLNNSTVADNAGPGDSIMYDPYNASDNNVVVTPQPTPLPMQEITINISGYVVDSRGNRVPNAYVTLYNDGKDVNIYGNPSFSGDGQNGALGYYSFVVHSPGNFTVSAEKSDVFLYNGTAGANASYDTDITLNIALTGYVFSPVVAPETVTPAPTLIQMPAAPPAPARTSTDNNVIGSLWKPAILVPAVFIAILVVGAALILLGSRRPKKRMQSDRKSATTPRVRENSKISPEYYAEIEEMSKEDMAQALMDPAFLEKVNEVAKKYGIGQSKIFYDLKKAAKKK